MRRAATIVAVIAVVIGLGLRWWGLGTKSLWFDEGYTAWVVSLPPGPLVRAVRVDTAPPLYYLVLHGWTRLAGESEAALRAPSAMATTAALVVVWLIVRRLFHDPVARAVGIALVAGSCLQVAYSHEARFYAAVGLMGAVDVYVMLRATAPRGRPVGWLAAAAAAWAVSLWLNNVSMVYLGCLSLAWLVAPGDRPWRGRCVDLVGVAVVAAAAFAPWVPSLLGQMRAVQASFWASPPTGRDLWLVFWRVGGAGGDGGGVVVAIGVIAGLAAGWRLRRVVALLAVVGLMPIALVFAYSCFRRSIFIDRAFIVSSLFVPLLAAAAVEAAGRSLRWAAVTLGAVLLAVSINAAMVDRYRTPDHEEDWRDACRYAAAGPAGLVVCDAPEGEVLFDYYARGRRFGPAAGVTGTPGDFYAADPPRTLRRVRSDADLADLRRQLVATPGPVVLVASHTLFADPDGRTLAALRADRRLVDRQTFAGVTVYWFAGR